jgi:hypothetical protein
MKLFQHYSGHTGASSAKHETRPGNEEYGKNIRDIIHRVRTSSRKALFINRPKNTLNQYRINSLA